MNLANAKIKFNTNFDWNSVANADENNIYLLTGKIGGYTNTALYPNLTSIPNSIIIFPAESSIYYCDSESQLNYVCHDGEWDIDSINFNNVYDMSNSIFMSLNMDNGSYSAWDVYEKQFDATSDPIFDNLLKLFSKIELSSQPTNYLNDITTGTASMGAYINLSSTSSKDYQGLSQLFYSNNSIYYDFDPLATFATESSIFDSSLTMSSATYYFNLPNFVTTIGGNCFNGFNNLQGCDFRNVTHISSNCFNNCPMPFNASGYVDNGNLKFNNVTSIDNNCFCSCSSLVNLDMKNVSSIGEKCFDDCSSLYSINFKNMTNMGEDCFDDCSSLHMIIGNFSTDPNWGGGFDNLPDEGIIINLNPNFTSEEFKDYLAAHVNEEFNNWTAV